jgi:sulfite reductase (NADPH) hemoprotein beta-component
MSVIDVSETTGRSRLSFASVAEIDEFVAMLRRYERGEISADVWRQFRLVRGTYGQRQADDAQMVRVKIPQGVLTSAQLTALADVGEEYSRGFGHITTRQNVQFHFVRLRDVERAMRRLADAGLTTREACGNSVRNITTCPYAGVAEDEAFDVTPYAEALTRYLLRHPLASTLPRKFKIAFEGCADDHVATAINDLGFRAVVSPNGGRGFRVTAGGGTSILCTAGSVLHEFLPTSEILRVAESVLRVFHRLGDYQHKQHNRMKFLIRALGWNGWLEEYGLELAAVRAGDLAPVLSVDALLVETPPARHDEDSKDIEVDEIAARAGVYVTRGPGILPLVIPVLKADEALFARWYVTNVRVQRQTAFVAVVVSVPLGDLTSEQMRQIGGLASVYGDGTVRVTGEQDLVMRWIPKTRVRKLYSALAAAGLGLAEAGTIADVASCPGAESCRLAVTQSRGLGRLLEDALRLRPDLIEAAETARIKISGCPNGCGQHHIATIGFQGSVRRVGSRAVPQYFVSIGGGATSGASFGRLVAKIPVRRAVIAVERLIGLYASSRTAGESAAAFFARVETSRAREVLADLEHLTADTAVPLDYVDLGDEAAFAPVVMEGECSA